MSAYGAGKDLATIREALEGALEYIGDADGECLVCGGESMDGSIGLPYHDECPCRKIRQAIEMLEEQ